MRAKSKVFALRDCACQRRSQARPVGLPVKQETMARSRLTSTRKKPSGGEGGPGGWWRLAGGVVAIGLAVAVYLLYNEGRQPQSKAGWFALTVFIMLWPRPLRIVPTTLFHN